MDALRDHRRSDLRHDRDVHRVRCSVNRRDHRVTDDHLVNRKNGLRDDDHRLLSDDRHRMDCFCEVCLLMVVYLSIHNHDHRVDLSIDPPCYYVDDLKLDGNLDVSRGHHMNDLLDDHLMDDDHHDVLVGHRMNAMDGRSDLMMVVNRVNRNCALRDRKMDVSLDVMTDVSLCLRMNDLLVDHLTDGTMDVSHDLRMNDQLGDQNLDVSRANRSCALRDLKMDGTMDVSHDLRMNDQLDDQNLVDGRHDVPDDLRMNAMDDRNDLTMGVNLLNRSCVLRDLKTDGNLDASLCHRMNVMDDLTMGVNRAIRNCVRRDRNLDANLDVMSHRVMLMGDLNMSCDRMSHDHLQCDHLMMRRHDTNQNLVVMTLDVKNPDGKMKIHHEIHPKKGDLMKVGRKMI